MPAGLLNRRRAAAHVTTHLALLVVFTISGCAPAMQSTARGPLTPEQIAELWIEPRDIARRDLFLGPGDRDMMPEDGATFQFRDVDLTGFSRGYDVVDGQGREWSVKQGVELQSEIAASRLLWAVGYHQPPMYLVRHWTLDGGPSPGPKMAGRFRPDLAAWKRVSDWSWQQNPFVGTRPFRGLIALNLLINNWDLKGTNNKIYTRDADNRDDDEKTRGPDRWYIVRDLGAAFGKSRAFPHGTRNNIADFESQTFVTGVKDGIVQFYYQGRHKELLADITPADVVWACEWISKLSDRQLDDAFRAAGYSETERYRFIRKLKQKVAEGLALRERRNR